MGYVRHPWRVIRISAMDGSGPYMDSLAQDSLHAEKKHGKTQTWNQYQKELLKTLQLADVRNLRRTNSSLRTIITVSTDGSLTVWFFGTRSLGSARWQFRGGVLNQENISYLRFNIEWNNSNYRNQWLLWPGCVHLSKSSARLSWQKNTAMFPQRFPTSWKTSSGQRSVECDPAPKRCKFTSLRQKCETTLGFAIPGRTKKSNTLPANSTNSYRISTWENKKPIKTCSSANPSRAYLSIHHSCGGHPERIEIAPGKAVELLASGNLKAVDLNQGFWLNYSNLPTWK